MKKTILFLAISLLSSSTFAQARIEASQIDREKLAGLELKKFANHHYLGTGLSTGGSVLIVSGFLMQLDANIQHSNSFLHPGLEGERMRERADKMMKSSGVLMSVGQLLSLAGLVYKIEAPLHVKKAGLILSGDGVGIRVKIN